MSPSSVERNHSTCRVPEQIEKRIFEMNINGAKISAKCYIVIKLKEIYNEEQLANTMN